MSLLRIRRCLAIFVVLIALLISGCNSLFPTHAGARVSKQLELAVKYLAENKFDEAILAYQEVIRIDRKNTVAYRGLSLAYNLQKKAGNAEKALEDGLRQDSGNEELKLATAGFYADQGKKDQAETLYQEILSQNRDYLPAYQAYSRWLVAQGRQDDAIALLEKAKADNPLQNEISLLLADLYVRKGDNQKALAIISGLITRDPDQSLAYKVLEGMYANRWQELMDLGDEYTTQNHPKVGELFKLTALYNLGRYQEIVNQYEPLPEELKDSVQAKLILAQSYIKVGQQKRSADLVKSINVENIKDAGMFAALADYYLKVGQDTIARKLAMEGINTDETAIDNYLILYRSYEGEDEAEAKVWLFEYLLKSVHGAAQAIDELIASGINPDVFQGMAVKGEKDAVRVTSGVTVQYLERTSYNNGLYFSFATRVAKAQLTPPSIQEKARRFVIDVGPRPFETSPSKLQKRVNESIARGNHLWEVGDSDIHMGMKQPGSYYVLLIFLDENNNVVGYYQTPEPMIAK
ncbi:MAG: tetratricopeptide repeat protein [Syntrophothermus sp.]|uniref:tetratricopeptide repeat protein n=1 Tax=Syntrophothermus sp. TaxID=2736299 RepID=UPI00257DBC03|nr:tetratricopeptide repeat protein [Syntrophothermus sp.]NSW82445.1 tetratricopeptide repeat protein [Syntrophothermus sp.]